METMNLSTAHPDTYVKNVDGETNNERRHRMQLEASRKQAAFAVANKRDSLQGKLIREEQGISGREGYVAWNRERAEEIRDALDGGVIQATLSSVGTSKVGTRVLVTGVAVVDTANGTETVALRGEATIRDMADPRILNGTGVALRLAARRGLTAKGTERKGFDAETVGTAEGELRIGVRGVLHASRFVRVIASAL